MFSKRQFIFECEWIYFRPIFSVCVEEQEEIALFPKLLSQEQYIKEF